MVRSSSLALVLGLGVTLGCGGSDTDPAAPKGARILSFKATPSVIAIGQEVTLSWETVNAMGVDWAAQTPAAKRNRRVRMENRSVAAM